MDTNLKVKTAQAADIAGVGYEGFRSWLKRGLLKSTGLLPKFYGPNAPAEISDAKRWQWSSFGFADLCCFRITKKLLDAGLPWDFVNSIVSREDIHRSHHLDRPDERYLAVFPESGEFKLYSVETLAADMSAGIIAEEMMTVLDLKAIRREVLSRMETSAE